jgi:hypothetical protein
MMTIATKKNSHNLILLNIVNAAVWKRFERNLTFAVVATAAIIIGIGY